QGGGGRRDARQGRARGQDDGRRADAGPRRPEGGPRAGGLLRGRAPAIGGGRRGGHEGDDSARGSKGTRQLPRRTQRRPPGPGGDIVVPAARGGRRHLGDRRSVATVKKEAPWRSTQQRSIRGPPAPGS